MIGIKVTPTTLPKSRFTIPPLRTHVLYWILSILFVTRSFIQGLGKGLVPTLAGIMELVMRAGIATVGSIYFGFSGIAASNPAAWIGALLVLLPSTFIMRKRLKAQANAPRAI